MSRFKRVPTSRLEAILSDPYTRGVNGEDYEQYREEILEIVYRRAEKKMNRQMEKYLKEKDFYENNIIFELRDPSVILWVLLNFKKLEDERFFSVNLN